YGASVMWKTVKLKDVLTYEKVNGQGSSLPYLGMENISSDTMQIVGGLEIPASTSSTFKFDETHVLYGRLRPYLKKVLVPSFEGQCSTEIFCLKPSSSLNRKFLAYWLLSPKIATKIENTCTGARMPRANMNAILEFDFFLPPLAEQQRIVAKLDAAYAEIETATIAIKLKQANYQALKKAFLAQELQSEAT
ncbi:MAG: restriction endonuclease subunit S, partial [Candidatus Latescibacteria bacterium]|nr:restriction endonuclease subunit S [Candidatus Latescibacterota bacterium]